MFVTSAPSSADTARALGLLEEYCTKLRRPEEQQLKTAIQRVMGIFKSNLFEALLGESVKHNQSIQQLRWSVKVLLNCVCNVIVARDKEKHVTASAVSLVSLWNSHCSERPCLSDALNKTAEIQICFMTFNQNKRSTCNVYKN